MRKALAVALLTSAPTAHGAGELWGNHYENDHFGLVLICLLPLIGMSIIFDEGVHGLTHWLDHKRQRSGAAPPRFESHNVYEIYYMLLTRFKSEMMVLGYLAFIVWCCNVGDLFPEIVDAINDGSGSGSGSTSNSGSGSSGRRLAASTCVTMSGQLTSPSWGSNASSCLTHSFPTQVR